MASNAPATNILNGYPIRNFDSNDPGATAWANDIKGGHHQYQTLAQRDAITDERREAGMTCFVVDTGITYVLGVGLTNGEWADTQAAIVGRVSDLEDRADATDVAVATLQSDVAGLTVGDSYRVPNLADLPSTPNATGITEFAEVYDDSVTSANNGRYFRENGDTVWTLVPGDLTGRVATVEAEVDEIQQITDPIIASYSMVQIDSDQPILPVDHCMDTAGEIFLGVDVANGVMRIKLDEQDPQVLAITDLRLSDLNLMTYDGTEPDLPLIATLDQALLGFNTARMELTGRFPSQYNRPRIEGEPGGPLAEALRLATADRRQVTFYGQSNSNGWATQTVIHTSQPYQNLTFDVGVRATPTGGVIGTNPGMLATAPLVESIASGEGSVFQGESPVSGCCNRISELYSEETGIGPSNFVVFGSAPGHGGYPIDQLSPPSGTGWYNEVVTAHISQAAVLSAAAGETIAPLCCVWIQGEGDQSTDPQVWADKLELIRLAMEADFTAAHGVARVLHLIAVPVCKVGTGAGGAVMGAWLASEQHPQIHLGRPLYGYVTTDGTHLDPVCRVRIGQTSGRDAWALVQNRRPDWIRPRSVTARGRVVRVTCDVPTLPLRLDVSDLRPTQDMGFKITDSIGTLGIVPGSISAFGNVVQMTVDRNLDSSPVLRYALDYNSSGSEFDGFAAAGNVCDSTPWETHVSGVTYREPYLMPGFSMAVQQFIEY